MELIMQVSILALLSSNITYFTCELWKWKNRGTVAWALLYTMFLCVFNTPFGVHQLVDLSMWLFGRALAGGKDVDLTCRRQKTRRSFRDHICRLTPSFLLVALDTGAWEGFERGSLNPHASNLMNSKLAALCADCKHVSGDCHVGLRYSLPLNPSYKSATNAISPSQRPTLGKAGDLFSVTLDLVFGLESLCSLWCTEQWGYYMVAECTAVSGHNFALAMHCQRDWQHVHINEPYYYFSEPKKGCYSR